MTAKILIVDDAVEATWLLNRMLNEAGYEVQVAHNGLEGLKQAFSFRPDLILLDVMMPEMDGWSTLTRLREVSDVPVIMLTAIGAEDAKIQGLDLGADDYLTKPFGVEELKARIRATLRRVSSAPEDLQVLRLDNGQLVIDHSSQQVIVRGQEVSVSPTEYKLLFYLAQNAGRVLSYAQILDHIWGTYHDDSGDNIKVFVWSLRRKVEEEPSKPRYIVTKRGIGYYMPKL